MAHRQDESSTLTNSIQARTISDKEQRNDETSESTDQLCSVPSSSGSTNESKEILVTVIRATDVALGLRRIPAGFYVVLHHDDLEWRTENKPSSVNSDVVEWSGPIPLPSDSSAVVRVEVYATFEFQPMLGTGEQLQRFTTTVGQLIDRSAKDAPFTFPSKDGDAVSPCSSILVAVKWRKGKNSDPSGSTVLGPRWSTAEPLGELEDATNQGHSALSRYRKREEKRDLERSIQQFERALSVCPRYHPCRAAAQSNLAMAKLILSRVEGTYALLEVALRLYRDALAARLPSHPDRPLTLIQLASVYFARLQKHGNHVDEADAGESLHEAIALSTVESYERRAATVMLHLRVGHGRGSVQPDGQSSIEPDPTPSSIDENPLNLCVWLLERFKQLDDLAALQRAIRILEGLVRPTSRWDRSYRVALGNLGTALSYRFERLGQLSDLENAISRKREAVDLIPDGHPDKPIYLNNLGNSFQTRFERLGKPSDINDAISTLKEAVGLTPRGHPYMPMYFNNLGNSFKVRFERFGQLSDLEDAISRQQDAINLTPHGHPHKHGYLNNLGSSFQTRFKHLGEPGDIKNAISILREAVNLPPHGHPDKPMYLNNLGSSFLACFMSYGQLSDLENATSTLKGAVDLTLYSHPRKPWYLNDLGGCFQVRFKRLGKPSDLEDAILTLKNAVDLTPHGHPDMPMYLNNLGGSFQTRFEHLGQPRDLEDAILTLKEAVDLTPDGNPRKPTYLNSLGSSFQARFECLGKSSDLKDAISMQTKAVDLTPCGHPHMPGYLSNLGNSFQARFERFGKLSDLEDAITTLRKAVDLTSHDHPRRFMYLNNLGDSFQVRFERLGQLSDLEDAISSKRDAIGLIPDDHPDKPIYLNNLGNSYRSRFDRLGRLSDLEDAILRQRSAVDLTSHGGLHRPAYLNNLGGSLHTRFKHLGELSDLKDAILMQREAVNLTPDGHPRMPGYLNNLGNFLRARFKCLGELSDIEDAVSTLREAVDLTSHGHPSKPIYLNNLGNSFQARFEHLGELSDLEDGISRRRDAIELTPHGDPRKSMYLSNLGNSFQSRFKLFGQPRDLHHALSLYSHVASLPTGSTSVRFSAAGDWILCARLIRDRSLLHAYSVAINLLPQLAWIGFPLSHRYDELLRNANVVREAAAAALTAGSPKTAVEWLEQGRSIIWGELFQLRNSYEELSSAHPDYASRLHALSTQLDQASAAHEQSLSTLSEQNQTRVHHTTESLRQAADRHRALAIERDKLLREIRRLPGFERFLLRKPFSQLCAAAHSGPVVILNAAEARCDALIVVANVDHVIHVPLPALTLKRSVDLQNILKGFVRDTRVGGWGAPIGTSWNSILSPLWKSVVKPVLDALAFSVVRGTTEITAISFIPASEQLPEELSRIFWCPTGPLAFLPIHAAGYYDEQYSEPGHKVFDFVVSSYVPSLSILLGSSHPSAAPPSSALRLLLIPQPPSDGCRKLPGVAVELAHIRDVIRNSPLACTTLEPSEGRVEEVLDLMKQTDWVHFACHGVQDGVDSGLRLADRRRLKLRNIVALSRPRGGLAFLSACQTAKGDKNLSDEAIHVAAGMLFAGYGGVVGTMWSINDDIAPIVAKDVYERLLGKGLRLDHREAARALHEAIRDLRNRKDVSFDEWIPFIHVGL